MMRIALLAVVLGCLMLAAPAPSMADELRIGTKVVPSSMDPHYHASGENSTMLPHVYDALVRLDENLHARPALATSWRIVSDTVWEFELRRGVVFHDNTPFTAEDVAFTFARIPNVKNSPGSYEVFTRRIARVEVVSPYRVRFHTRGPHPLLEHDLSGIMILPHHLGADVDTRAFNAGHAALGTGPYRLVSWRPGSDMRLARNERYWGARPEWDSVHFIPIGSNPTRIAALLNREVDLIEDVALADRERLMSNRSVRAYESPLARLMFVHLDSARESSPFVRGADGRALPQNPLRDARVRRALSLALNREAIIEHLLDGAGVPASQVLPARFEGANSMLLPDRYDPAAARRLLREAGYPNGFRITLHATSDRYPNDARVAQAIAQMWWRIGVITEVETLTRNVFFPAAARQEFSAYFAGWGETSVANALAGLIHSYNPGRGMGAGNRARYANAEVDALVDQALATVDARRRNTLLAQAQQIAFRDDQGLIPLYHPTASWASVTDLTYDANVEGATQAMRAHRLRQAAQ